MAFETVVVADVTTGQKTLPSPSYQTSEAISGGEAVYYDSTNEEVTLANNAATTTAAVKGIAMTSAALGGFIIVAETGIIDPGFTAVEGTLYYLSSTDGKIAAEGDATLGTGTVASAIYRGLSDGTVQMEINNTGSTRP